MDNLSNGLEFRCNFVKEPLTQLIVWLLGFVSGFAFILAAHGFIGIVLCGLCLIALPFWWEYQTYNFRHKSFIFIKDNVIEIKVWSRRAKTYPIDCIEKVMVVDFDKDEVTSVMKCCVFPVAFGYAGGDIIPKVGVLIFFKRSYLKSVYPIFFNPSDPDLFAKTLTERIKNE